MSDLVAISVILIETSVLVIIVLFLIKPIFGAIMSHLEETQPLRDSVKPKNKIIIFLKKQTDEK